jgi:hypothetical protein
VLNADTWCPGSVKAAVEGWDRARVRLLVVGSDELATTSRLAGALMPWSEVSRLAAEPSGLYEASWRRLWAGGDLDVARWDGPCIDCGTPARYLAANLAASGGVSVVGEGSRVEGVIERTVVWDGSEVYAHEHLVDAIRANGFTVLVR